MQIKFFQGLSQKSLNTKQLTGNLILPIKLINGNRTWPE